MRTLPLILAWLLPVWGCLVLATGCGWWMSRRCPQQTSASFVANWNARVRSWWWILGVGSLALLVGPLGLVLFFAVISLQSYREFVNIAPTSSSVRWSLVPQGCILVGYILVPLQYALILLGEWRAILFVAPCLFAVVYRMGGCRGVAGTHERTLDGPIAGALVCVYGISFVLSPLWLCTTGGQPEAILNICFLALTAQASDVLQYLWGNAIGRRRVAPSISPAKTVEGLVGGVISCGLLAVVTAPMFGFGRVQAGLLALWIALGGFLGGLLLSAIKRRRGIKDWGTMLPGHGGMLDRVDSLWLSAPGYTAALALLPALPP